MVLISWIDEVLEYFDEVGLDEIDRQIQERRDYFFSLGLATSSGCKEGVNSFLIRGSSCNLGNKKTKNKERGDYMKLDNFLQLNKGNQEVFPFIVGTNDLITSDFQDYDVVSYEMKDSSESGTGYKSMEVFCRKALKLKEVFTQGDTSGFYFIHILDVGTHILFQVGDDNHGVRKMMVKSRLEGLGIVDFLNTRISELREGLSEDDSIPDKVMQELQKEVMEKGEAFFSDSADIYIGGY